MKSGNLLTMQRNQKESQFEIVEMKAIKTEFDKNWRTESLARWYNTLGVTGSSPAHVKIIQRI